MFYRVSNGGSSVEWTLIKSPTAISGTSSISLASYTSYSYIVWLGTHANLGSFYYTPANCTIVIPTQTIQQFEEHSRWTMTRYGVIKDITASSRIDYYVASYTSYYSLIGVKV